MTGGFNAIVIRRIDSRDELRDGEEYTYCVRCKHMGAINLRSPEVWASDAVPYCQHCTFAELQRVTEEVAQIYAEREAALRKRRWWLRAGKVVYWGGVLSVPLPQVTIGLLNPRAA